MLPRGRAHLHLPSQQLSISHQKKQSLPCSAPALLIACAQLQQLGQDPVDTYTPAQVPSSCQVESTHTNHLKPCKKQKPAYACSRNARRHGLGWPGCPHPGCWGQGRDTRVCKLLSRTNVLSYVSVPGWFVPPRQPRRTQGIAASSPIPPFFFFLLQGHL